MATDVMTDAQQKLVEDNLKIVYSVIAKCYPTWVGDQEIVSAGWSGLCDAALAWDKEKGSFPTFAYSCIRNAIKKEFRQRNKRVSVVSIDSPVTDDLTMEDTLIGDEDVDISTIVNSRFLDSLTESERQVFELRVYGYSLNEIGRLLGYHQQKVWRICQKIRNKFQKTAQLV